MVSAFLSLTFLAMAARSTGSPREGVYWGPAPESRNSATAFFACVGESGREPKLIISFPEDLNASTWASIDNDCDVVKVVVVFERRIEELLDYEGLSSSSGGMGKSIVL